MLGSVLERSVDYITAFVDFVIFTESIYDAIGLETMEKMTDTRGP